MASEQKLQSTKDATSGESINPSHHTEQPSCCTDSGLKGEPVTHPVTDLPEDRREQVEGCTANEGYGVVTEGEQEKGEEAGIGERKQEEEEKTKDEKVTCEDTAHQVTNAEVSENKEVPVAILVTVDENSPLEEGAEQGPQVTGGETGPQVTGGETGPQVTGEETGLQVTGEETEPQVTGEETGPQVTGEETGPQVTGEETGPQVTDEETGPQVTEVQETDPQKTDEGSAPQATIPERGAQVSDTGVHEMPDAQVSDAGEKWIDMLVHTIVTEVTGEGDCTGEQDTGAQVSVDAADTTAVLTEEEEHSTVQVTGMETMAGEQVTVQGTGAAAATQVNTDSQVSTDNTDIALHVSGQEPGIQVKTEQVTAIPGQVHEEITGIDKQLEDTATHREDSAGVQVTGKEVQEDIRSNLEAGGQVIAWGEEADREVTPDLDILSGREGTGDQDQPVACREKEWPSLICTAGEVRTVTAEQGDTQQESVTQKEPSDKTPEMKEREIVEDEYTPTPETPIEREIRLAMEREMTLRQERGISSPIGHPELVEVRGKKISLEPVAVSGKERQLAGAQMQRDIQLETQREQDLVELGKVMGTYDRGPQQELQERKMIFESMITEPDAPIVKKQTEPQQQPKPQEAPPLIVPVATNHAVPAKDIKKGPSYTEANGSNVIIIEHSSLLRRSAPGNTFNSAPADSRRSTPADYYRSTPADSRRSVSAEISRTNWSGSPLPNSADSTIPPGSPYQLLRSPSPRSILEREIEEVKERERELRRQRSSIYGRDDGVEEPTQNTQEITYDAQSVYQPERPSWGKLEVNWPPNKEAAMNGQQEVLDSPRSRRQRSALHKSWESGNPNPKDD